LPAAAQKSAHQTASPATSSATIRILYGESDEHTLGSRSSEMKEAGQNVTTALNRKAIQEALQKDVFDLVILGATLSKEDRHHLPYMVKKAHTGAKVLVLHAGTHHHEVDAAVDSDLSMPRILERVASLFQ
jgi:DNA-binding NtrC family response regulator